MELSESCSIQSPSLPRTAIYHQLFEMLGTIYCRFFHSAISRPVAGKYRCWKCLRNLTRLVGRDHRDLLSYCEQDGVRAHPANVCGKWDITGRHVWHD